MDKKGFSAAEGKIKIMKVLSKQHNSRMCAICGLDNLYGVKAPFYNMADRSVMSVFRYHDHHQSYPGRVHGGLITAMLDELGLRGLWAWRDGSEEEFGVTMSLETSYRKPVPYDVDLVAKGIIVRDTRLFFAVEGSIMDMAGNVLANGVTRYLRLPLDKIAEKSDIHEQMAYLIADDVTDIL